MHVVNEKMNVSFQDFQILIHYTGADNELNKKKISHGNYNDQNKEHHRTKPSLINELKTN